MHCNTASHQTGLGFDNLLYKLSSYKVNYGLVLNDLNDPNSTVAKPTILKETSNLGDFWHFPTHTDKFKDEIV